MNNQSPNLRPYFDVARPAHFRVRGDLIEELCVPEFIVRSLPRSAQQYAWWLKYCGLTEKEAPFAKTQECRGLPYRMTPRYVLQSAVLPGRLEYTNIVTDGSRWVTGCEYYGLFDFVVQRTVEFAVTTGMREDLAMRMLRPSKCANAVDYRRGSAWAIGYEHGTGLCTILAMDHKETQRLFLAEKPGYHTPFPDRI